MKTSSRKRPAAGRPASRSPPKTTTPSHEDTSPLVSDLSVTSPELFYFCGSAAFGNFTTASVVTRIFLMCALLVSVYVAYWFRLLSIQMYGYLIHEFDPWFNFRATQYMSAHGWKAFFHWFDYASWYPLGRPVGSTTYPGLQITAVAIHRGLNAMGISMSLNDVCVLIPAWFGALATILLAALTYEVSASLAATSFAAVGFCILPAHLMRSMAGEFDNECIALAAMLLTFYLWVRSLRCPRSWPIGVLAGLAYGYMVAAWGGYIFVINMVALHAGVCALNDWMSNTYNPSLLRAYALFYVIGTAIATRVPPVGMAPFKSLEQLSALMVLLFLLGLEMAERVRARTPDVAVRSRANMLIRFCVFCVMGGVVLLVAALLAPTGYFGPLSSRVRALFVAHTRTGNPLVDSVAEHQGTSWAELFRYFHVFGILWTSGALFLPLVPARNESGMVFALLFNVTTQYFAGRMSRLVVIAGPSAVLTNALIMGAVGEWCGRQLFWTTEDECLDSAIHRRLLLEVQGECQTAQHKRDDAPISEKQPPRGGRNQGKGNDARRSVSPPHRTSTMKRNLLGLNPRRVLREYRFPSGPDMAVLILTLSAVIGSVLSLFALWCSFESRSAFAQPQIAFAATFDNGTEGIVDDYLQAYLWLKNNTPTDARVLAWWDYGYQITGIGERTTLADGNTWNHEHIATIGKMLTSPVAEAHSLVRHMADYVLVWRDDIGKSPHMARIGNSVYRDICPADPLCARTWFTEQGPTELSQGSLIFNLAMPDGLPDRYAEEEEATTTTRQEPAQWMSLFEPRYSSEFGLVMIYEVMNVSKESKQWVANPENRRCDRPGSWICPGQYPPAKEIQDMLAKRVDFSQIEDFNRKGEKDDAYYKAYMAEH